MRPEVCVDQLQDAIVVFLFDSHQFIVSVFNPFFIGVWAGQQQPLGCFFGAPSSSHPLSIDVSSEGWTHNTLGLCEGRGISSVVEHRPSSS